MLVKFVSCKTFNISFYIPFYTSFNRLGDGSTYKYATIKSLLHHLTQAKNFATLNKSIKIKFKFKSQNIFKKSTKLQMRRNKLYVF